MNSTRMPGLLVSLLAMLLSVATAAGAATQVNLDNFIRAESDTYFKKKVDEAGIGRLNHSRTPPPVENQPIVRMNRDTLYSMGVFDLTEPVTLTMPNADGRFMSMVVTNEDHYIKLVGYKPGDYTLTRDKIGTRYVQVVFRTFANSADPKDVAAANAIQDQIRIKQKSAGRFEIPDWDQTSLTAVRKAILGLGPFVPDSQRMFGDKNEVDPVRHLVGTAGGFGGNKQDDAIYLNVTPQKNDGQTPHVLSVKNVPVDGFWSISLYNSDGFFVKNDLGAYSLNSSTATKNADGSVSVRFGGCDGKVANCLPIMKDWNYTVRLYRPRKEILDGSWKFPDAQPTN
jgi:hypothetical protein